MADFARVLTDQKNIQSQKVARSEVPDLEDGEVRLKVESFALTANNVTYAATGFDIGYWEFYPTGETGQGIVPVWGFARVVETNSDLMQEGDRVYGFLPFAEAFTITPVAHGSRGFRDGAAHRKDLPEVYNIYQKAAPNSSDAEHYQALLQPLIATSFLLYDWLFDNDWFGAKQIVVGSASSKTGLGLCAFLERHESRPYQIVGLTGAGNAGFVKELGFCDQVVSYDAIDSMAKVSSVYVDMAGNAKVKQALHSHLEGHLNHSSAVGISHWDQFARPQNLAGPKPEFFFAPAQIAKRKKDWGRGVIDNTIAEAMGYITRDAERWLNLQTHEGLAAGIEVFAQLANGEADPSQGHVVVL